METPAPRVQVGIKQWWHAGLVRSFSCLLWGFVIISSRMTHKEISNQPATGQDRRDKPRPRFSSKTRFRLLTFWTCQYFAFFCVLSYQRAVTPVISRQTQMKVGGYLFSHVQTCFSPTKLSQQRQYPNKCWPELSLLSFIFWHFNSWL